MKSLKEADAPQKEQGETEIQVLERLVKKDQEDTVWAKEMREKEEKFGLILGSLVRTRRYGQASEVDLIRVKGTVSNPPNRQ